jgi:uroporphyrinogen III methyltransferase/synthase
MEGKVFIIGAGPGDPGLLTIKARDVLMSCDCVVYDYLVNTEILNYARPDAERIYVGKRSGEHYVPQEYINQLLIAKALEGKLVGRLKGGDPFIFGRGGEEAEALVSVGIPWEVIPGISSAYAVPAYAGIPVTHRSYSSSVAFITGHEDACRSSSRIQWEKLATAVDTLVFLMCVKSLPAIVANLICYGRDPSTPVAIIRWGTYTHQETFTGTLGAIVEIAERHRIEPPAVVVVGDVVSLVEKLNWFQLCADKDAGAPLAGAQLVGV